MKSLVQRHLASLITYGNYINMFTYFTLIENCLIAFKPLASKFFILMILR